MTPNTTANWQEQAHQSLLKGDYAQAASLYEEAIVAEPGAKSYYWQLGLMLLLQGQEAEAQTTWLVGMAEGEPEDIEQWTEELSQALQAEAERRRELKDYKVAWAIRQHIREIKPGDVENRLYLLALSTAIEGYTGEEPQELGILDALKSDEEQSIDSELLLRVWKDVIDCAPAHPLTLELTEACLPHLQEPGPLIVTLIDFVNDLAYSAKRFELASRFTELGLRLEPRHPELLRLLAAFYQDIGEYEKGIETAKFCYSVMEKIEDKIYANMLLMRAFMSAGGYWDEFYAAMARQEKLIAALIEEQPTSLDENAVVRLYTSTFFIPYFQDEPQKHAKLRNEIAALAQLNIEKLAQEFVEKYRQQRTPLVYAGEQTRRLKIGYISYCLRSHSVGWLARWVFEHHDRERFQINSYLISSQKLVGDPLRDWYISKSDKAQLLSLYSREAADRIYEDEIDILVDLDSITMSPTCEVMAFKPAPIQVTWLGWDASGIPMIDYYMADPYVLPESAQEYYSEKIWRLPNTYIAVDGFEMGVPTLRREQLNLPSDAIIYYTGQRGYKQNPDTVRLQMQVLKAVPNSYLLIKGLADKESIEKFFGGIAESEGVSSDRLKFLPYAPSEAMHRANLSIADIALDTYPYNGATTTLEILWMGIPIVTRVGQQFSSRNTYGMLKNVGVEEGIAWSDEEYVEWGIRLGRDANLRQAVTWKLRQSRHTAPLWNGKQFTREMEKAYEQMWEIYLNKNS